MIFNKQYVGVKIVTSIYLGYKHIWPKGIYPGHSIDMSKSPIFWDITEFPVLQTLKDIPEGLHLGIKNNFGFGNFG